MTQHDTAPSAGEDAYQGYTAYKGWTGATLFQDADGAYYAKEFAGLRVAGADVLEVGFGAGACLAWLRAQGARVAGLEAQAELVAAARAVGFEAHHADAFDWTAAAGRFDTICMFDVLEHVADEAVAGLLGRCAAALKPGGAMLIRTPNMASPFGLHYQAADPTHRTTISGARIAHLIARDQLPLHLEAWRDQALPAPRGLGARLKRVGSDLMRAGVRFALHNSYLRGEAIPLAMNAVILLRKTG